LILGRKGKGKKFLGGGKFGENAGGEQENKWVDRLRLSNDKSEHERGRLCPKRTKQEKLKRKLYVSCLSLDAGEWYEKKRAGRRAIELREIVTRAFVRGRGGRAQNAIFSEDTVFNIQGPGNEPVSPLPFAGAEPARDEARINASGGPGVPPETRQVAPRIGVIQ